MARVRSNAQGELESLSTTRQVMGTAAHYVGFATAPKLLTIAEEIVRGKVSYAEGDTIEGLAHLERAVRLEDSLRYNEPPDWYFPVRHYLGAMLLDAGRPGEAEVIYAADLQKNSDNGYALYGLTIALEQQGKKLDAADIAERFANAWATATYTLSSSRF